MKRVELTPDARNTRLGGVDGSVAVLKVKVLAKGEDDVFLPHLDTNWTLRKTNALGQGGECAVTMPSYRPVAQEYGTGGLPLPEA